MATLVYSDVDGVDRSFSLGQEPVTVGRGAECAIRSDDPRVSRVHARFFVEQGALWVEDLGSSNGIFVGPDKVSRAKVPTGELILVGSLLIRLLPASGTLPPPNGLHGTLASWLDMERKARAAIEDERDAFARRVGEMHQQLSAVMSARTMDPDAPELTRQRDEADGRAAALEGELEIARSALEAARGELAKVREPRQKNVANETAGIAAAEKLAEADLMISSLQHELAELRRKVGAAASDPADGAQVGQLRARAEKAEKELVAVTSQFETRRDRIIELEEQVGKVRDIEQRADEADKRASAADTMAKAMAKDVAEALRRAADADTKARGVSRDLADALRRAEQAEARTSTGAAALREAEARATTAEARIVELEKELATTIERAQRETVGKVAQVERDLGAKLAQVQRELAAERSTSLSLVDRKTQLERDLTDARAQLPVLQQRLEAAERKAASAEDEIDSLQDRVEDLESGIAVAETASKAAVDEAQAALRAEQATAAEARAAAETQLREARDRMAELEHAAAERAGLTEAERDQLTDALERAADAERKVDALIARAEAADLAIGRAGALQRQLDEALTRLAWLEREQSARGRDIRPPAEPSEAVTADRIAAAETRAREADGRARDAETKAGEAAARVAEAERRAEAAARDAEAAVRDAKAGAGEADGRARDAEARASEATARVHEAVARVAAIEQHAEQLRAHGEALAAQLVELQHRAAHAEETSRASSESERRIASAEQRVTAAEQRGQLAEQRAQGAEGNAQALARQVAEMQGKIVALEREVASADNVRSFAAETEREIASLQRDLREARSKLTQVTLERDRLLTDLRDARSSGDTDTTARRLPAPTKPFDPDVTAQVDVAKYETLIVKAAELEQKVAQLEHDDAALRRQLTEAEQRVRAAAIGLDDDDDDNELTRTGSQLPIAALAEHVATIEESMNSLRANMRAASDETAMMEPSDSVNAISSAVSQAAEHVEVARAAIRALQSSIGLTA